VSAGNQPFPMTHFEAFLLFAVVISLAFGFLGRRQPKDRVRYIAWSLFWFLALGIGIAWIMFPFSK
jgi:hypothetical protein